MNEIDWSRLLEITREGIVERTIFGLVMVCDSQHALSSNRVDPLLFGRSLMKPFQMKAIAQDLQSLDWEEKALALSSHNGTHLHTSVAQRMVPQGRTQSLMLPSSLPMGGGATEKSIWQNPCSGKHAAILQACIKRGWPTENYIDNDHPYNVEFRKSLEVRLGTSLIERVVAPDGCRLPTYATHLSEIARLFATLARDKNEDWIWEAQHRHPELIGGQNRLDSAILAACPQLFAKEGADGLLGISVDDPRYPDGLGMVIKLAHGYDMTMLWHIAYVVLRDLAIDIPVPPLLSGQTVVAKPVLHDIWGTRSH